MKTLFSTIAGLALLLICSCIHAGPAAPAMVLMTYNIHGCFGLDKKLDYVRIADVIRKTGAETVALQEVDKNTRRSGNTDQAAKIAEQLKYHHLFGRTIKRDNGEYGNALISRYPLELVDNFPISYVHERRCVLVAKVLAPEPYYVLATHFDHTKKSEEARVKSVQIIKEYLEKNPQYRPAVLMGDLNALPHRPPIHRVREAGFRILNDAAPGMLSFPAAKPKYLLDYILLWKGEKAEIRSCFVVDEPVASDHRPVVALVVLPGGAEK